MKNNGILLYKVWIAGEAVFFLGEQFLYSLLLVFSVGALIACGQNLQTLTDVSHTAMNGVLIGMALLFLFTVICVILLMRIIRHPWILLWVALFTSGLGLLVRYDLDHDLNLTLNLSFAMVMVFVLGNVIRIFARGMFEEWLEEQIYLSDRWDDCDFSCDGLKINPEFRSFFEILSVRFISFHVPDEQLTQDSISSTQPMKKANVVFQAKNRFLFLKPKFRLCVNYYTHLFESKEMEVMIDKKSGM